MQHIILLIPPLWDEEHIRRDLCQHLPISLTLHSQLRDQQLSTHLHNLTLSQYALVSPYSPVPSHQSLPILRYASIRSSRLDPAYSWRRRTLNSENGQLEEIQRGVRSDT